MAVGVMIGEGSSQTVPKRGLIAVVSLSNCWWHLPGKFDLLLCQHSTNMIGPLLLPLPA